MVLIKFPLLVMMLVLILKLRSTHGLKGSRDYLPDSTNKKRLPNNYITAILFSITLILGQMVFQVKCCNSDVL